MRYEVTGVMFEVSGVNMMHKKADRSNAGELCDATNLYGRRDEK